MLRAALALAGLLLAALVGGQLALPRVAERRLTSDLAETGQVRHVSVEAMLAIKLLFKRADRVEVDMAEARATSNGNLAEWIRRANGTRELDARVDLVRLGPLRLHAVRLLKDHERLSGQATLSDRELAAALPPQFQVRPVEDPSGEF